MYGLLLDRCIRKILLFFSLVNYLNNRILLELLLRVMGGKEGQIDAVMLVYLLFVRYSTFFYGFFDVVWIIIFFFLYN
jgi:hypothetical protein